MPGTSLDDVLLVNPSQIRPATAHGIAQAEAELGVRLPSGYAAYVERLGEGALGNFVRVYEPAKLPAITRDWRGRINEYWFWDTSEAGLARESLQEHGVVLADSFDGDELCFDPADPETLYVLPRSEDAVRRVGPGFIAAVDWMLSGALNPWVEGWTFEAWTNRVEVRQVLHGRRLSDAARAIVDLGEHSHMVGLDDRKTYFLPAIGGRLSLYQENDGAGDTNADLTYDEAASPEAVEVVLAAMQGA
jgi:SMI1 / KNR4 family (SUKH-1)